MMRVEWLKIIVYIEVVIYKFTKSKFRTCMYVNMKKEFFRIKAQRIWLLLLEQKIIETFDVWIKKKINKPAFEISKKCKKEIRDCFWLV